MDTVNAVLLISLGFNKVFHALPCGKLLFTMEADIRKPAMAEEKGLTVVLREAWIGQGDSMS